MSWSECCGISTHDGDTNHLKSILRGDIDDTLDPIKIQEG